TLPVYWLSSGNLILAYNLYWIATFPLTALAAYLLIGYLLKPFGGDRWVSGLAALMIAFAQFRFFHVQQIEMLAMFPYLFGLYFLHRLIDSPRSRWAYGLVAAICLTLFTNNYYFIQLLIVIAIILAFTIKRIQANRPQRLQLLTAITVSGIFTL